MSRIIEPVPCIGISVADVADTGDMLESYHGLFAPLLAAGSKVSVPLGTCEG